MTTLKYKGLNCFVVLLRLIALALPIIGPAHSYILNHVMVSQFISGNTAKRYSISETLPASGCVIFNIQAPDTTVTTSWLCTLAVSEISWRVSECARLLSSNSRNDQFSIFLFILFYSLFLLLLKMLMMVNREQEWWWGVGTVREREREVITRNGREEEARYMLQHIAQQHRNVL